MFLVRARNLSTWMAIRNAERRAQRVADVREVALRVRRLIERLENPPANWYQRARSVAEYLCSPAAAQPEEPTDVPELID